jgi:hypothetical protein
MEIQLKYPYQASVSVNSAYVGGSMRRGFREEVRVWRDGLRLLMQNQVQMLERPMEPPIQLIIHLRRPRTTHRVDVGNFAKIIEDTIIAALDFDDHDGCLARGPYTGSRATEDNDPGEFLIIVRELNDVLDVHAHEDLGFLIR